MVEIYSLIEIHEVDFLSIKLIGQLKKKKDDWKKNQIARLLTLYFTRTFILRATFPVLKPIWIKDLK